MIAQKQHLNKTTEKFLCPTASGCSSDNSDISATNSLPNADISQKSDNASAIAENKKESHFTKALAFNLDVEVAS